MKSCSLTCKWLAAIVLSTLLGLSAWVTWDNWGRFVVTADASPANTLPAPQALARGEYLAHIGGCIACHTNKGGAPLAGGRRIDTPFGAVFISAPIKVSQAAVLEHGLVLSPFADTQVRDA